MLIFLHFAEGDLFLYKVKPNNNSETKGQRQCGYTFYFLQYSSESALDQEQVVTILDKWCKVIPYQLIFRILMPQGKRQVEVLSPYLKRK